jgi:ATP-dependent RNA helicase SUPV3L1/SUV3
MPPSPPRSVTAVLGPTNTGKTHLAVERMLGHATGMIGLPLRLLAREVYDRVRLRVGDHQVALVTGEEKIIPAQPRFWVCTVEAMPADIDVAFLAIDEIQLAADFDRGHIFTDRLLHRRGREETMLLGAATMRPIVEKLLSGVSHVSRPRFSKLSYAGQKKLTRLPRRTAVVAFSADMVYAVAELIRRQRGGAAVVLGALSPRTRNAQVALYQSGDVDYLVATDAIGMGLNMDVDHVAFATIRKFDGFQFRNLNPAELAQVAGRAGRYLNDGTFGVTGEAEPFDTETVDRIENHNFEPVRMLQWRNREYDFSSLESLRRSLNAMPRIDGLTRAQPGPDILALDAMSRDGDVVELAKGEEAVARLWEVCQIPDYRNISAAEHANLVGRIYRFLMTGDGRIPEDWFARQLAHCDRSEGDIDTLSNRISHVRTWTFVANRADWLEAPVFWQQRAREIEDKLSDALHERLSARFIDRRTSVLMKRLAQKDQLMSTVEENGAIHVEGEYVGRIQGFQFVPDGAASEVHGRTLKAASMSAVAAEITARAKAVSTSADPDLILARDARIRWHGDPIARLRAGAHVLKPRIDILADDQLNGPDREAVQARLQKFIERHVAKIIEPLVKLDEAEGLEGTVRGIAFRLVENLGVLPREQVAEEIKSLSQDERAKLRQLGVRFGAFNVYVPALLKPSASELRLLLWGLSLEKDGRVDIADLPESPGQGLTSTVFDRTTPRGFYGVCGYRICGNRVVRIDMLERLADVIRDRVFWRARIPEEKRPSGSVEGGGFMIVPDMMSLVGCSGDDFQAILRSLDFRMHRKKVKRPKVAEPEATAVAEAVAEPPSADATTPEETIEIPAAEVPPADIVSEPAPTIEIPAEVMPAEAVPAEATPAEATPAEAPAAETEEIEIEVWWPKDTGPFRHAQEKKHKKPHRRRDTPQEAAKADGDGAQKPDRPKRDRPHRKPDRAAAAKQERPERPPRKPERPIDPDSPFAVLGALKAQFGGKSS